MKGNYLAAEDNNGGVPVGKGVCKSSTPNPLVFSGVLSVSQSTQTLDMRVALSARPENVTNIFLNCLK